MTDFAVCSQIFLDGLQAGNETILSYRYVGPLSSIYEDITNPPPMITFDGCISLCGTAPDYDNWTIVSATISTWILPIIGLFLQAPFESNQNWATVLTLLHWIGSPISSLAAVLWNTEVSRRCSLMVEMAMLVMTPEIEEQYKDIRNAFFLLTVMNQYTINKAVDRRIAEKLLRVVLFSDSLKLSNQSGTLGKMIDERTDLARFARVNRKKGVIPVLISLGWFMFSFAISVQQAFGQVGFALEAHSLALGLLFAWVPIFILSCIVDRNPTQAEAIREELNKVVNHVKTALLDKETLEQYIRATGRPSASYDWINNLKDFRLADTDFQFFAEFAGQGRVRWHYGIAHEILDELDKCYVLEHGSNWLRDVESARKHFIIGSREISDVFDTKFDPKSLWQVGIAFILVGTSCLGAGILSYFQPPQGLGCRSGGYLVFFVIAISILILELWFWALIPKRSQVGIRRLSFVAEKVSWFDSHRIRAYFDEMTTRDCLQYILVFLESVNVIWLIYIVVAQVFGIYRSCACEAALWDRSVGYLDFSVESHYLDFGVQTSWISATVIVLFTMSIQFYHVLHGWFTQSHLSTVDYNMAQEGMKRSRAYRSMILWPKSAFRKIHNTIASMLSICVVNGTARWRAKTRWPRDHNRGTSSKV